LVSIEGRSLDLIKRHDEEATILFHSLHRKSGASLQQEAVASLQMHRLAG
jgi:hypothetical protein